MNVRQRFNPVPMDADSEFVVNGLSIAAFLPTADGALSVAGKTADGLNDITFIDAVPVTAGVFVELPCEFAVAGSVVTLSGGAAGTLFV